MNSSARILIVDDDAVERRILERLIADLGHQPVMAVNGRQALELIEADPPDLLLLDMMMPELSGAQTLERLRSDRRHRQLHVIVISAIDEIEQVAHCIELGADDYLVKPFNRTLLKARIGACLSQKALQDQKEEYRRQIEEYNRTLEERVEAQVREISEAQQATIFAMSRLAESRDNETGRHLERIREYSRMLCESLLRRSPYAGTITDKFVRNVYAASPLHDIGKVGVPDQILLKPEKLSPPEFEIMKRHATIGADTLRAVARQHPGNAFIAVGIAIAQSHHEKWDGSGYPNGAAGDDIPLAGRIVALADVYDALRSQRHYKAAFSHEQTRDILLEGKGRHFDPVVIDAFLASEDAFVEVSCVMEDEAAPQ